MLYGYNRIPCRAEGEGLDKAAGFPPHHRAKRGRGVGEPRCPAGRGQGQTARRRPAITPPMLILFNKPMGVLCQFTDSNLAHHAPDAVGLRPAGRGLSRRSPRPRQRGAVAADRRRPPAGPHRRPAVEDAQDLPGAGRGRPDEADLAPLRDGLTLKDGPTRPAQARLIAPPAIWARDPPVRYRKSVPDRWIEITLTEGRNRQVRRMTAHIGFPTLRLVRWRIGPHALDGLAPGTWRGPIWGRILTRNAAPTWPNEKGRPAGRPRVIRRLRAASRSGPAACRPSPWRRRRTCACCP